MQHLVPPESHSRLLHGSWMFIFLLSFICPDGEIGRRKGLKIPRSLNVPVRPRLGAPHIKQGLACFQCAGPLFYLIRKNSCGPQFLIFPSHGVLTTSSRTFRAGSLRQRWPNPLTSRRRLTSIAGLVMMDVVGYQ